MVVGFMAYTYHLLLWVATLVSVMSRSTASMGPSYLTHAASASLVLCSNRATRQEPSCLSSSKHPGSWT